MEDCSILSTNFSISFFWFWGYLKGLTFIGGVFGWSEVEWNGYNLYKEVSLEVHPKLVGTMAVTFAVLHSHK